MKKLISPGATIFRPIVISALIGIFATCDFAIFGIGVKLFKREEILSKLAQSKPAEKVRSQYNVKGGLASDRFLRIFHADNLTGFQSHDMHVSSELVPVWTSASYNANKVHLKIYV